MKDTAMPAQDDTSETRAAQPLAASLSALYTTHRAALVRMVLAMIGDADMAEDVCQDAFVAVLSGERGPAHGDDPVRHLYHTARCLGEQALRGRHEARLAPLSACPFANDPAERWTNPPFQAALLDDLPACWRIALMLQTLGFSRIETAFVLRCTANDVRVYVYSARRMLRTRAPVATPRGRPPLSGPAR
jgi:DNA-directed RNA polymerase specialized sigma24 family protein